MVGDQARFGPVRRGEFEEQGVCRVDGLGVGNHQHLLAAVLPDSMSDVRTDLRGLTDS